MWVEFKCPACGRDLDDDNSMANFMICNESSHGTLRFFTEDGCFFTSDKKVAEELTKKGKRVHVVDPRASRETSLRLRQGEDLRVERVFTSLEESPPVVSQKPIKGTALFSFRLLFLGTIN